MIRCNQGHSIPWLEMDYKVETPRRSCIMERDSRRWMRF